MKDPRDPNKITYSLSTLIWTGLLMFLTKVEARRQINWRFEQKEFLSHLNELSHSSSKKVAHSDTVSYLLEKINPEHLQHFNVWLVNQLIRKKCLDRFRFLGRYWLVALDGTGHLRFKRRHCEQCLKRKTRDGKNIYLHPVLEAKLVFSNGMSLSLLTEFIRMQDGKEKQDCERAAFYRLAPKLKKLFPQLPICLLGDSLYVCEPVMRLCEKNKWKYLLSFKRGSMPMIFDWCQVWLRKFCAGNKSKVTTEKGVEQQYHFIPEIEHPMKDLKFGYLECREKNQKKKTKKKETCFVWISNLNITQKNHIEIAGGARRRWKIENEGFNMQKNGGYRLEHPYSMHEVGMMNFYLLLQIAHSINQLMEKGSLIKKVFEKGLGSIRNIAHQLLEDLRCRAPDPSWLNIKIQIRFLDSG